MHDPLLVLDAQAGVRDIDAFSVVATPTISPVCSRCSAASSLAIGRYFIGRALILSSVT